MAKAFGHRVQLAYDLPAGGPYTVVKKRVGLQPKNPCSFLLRVQYAKQLMADRRLSGRRLAQEAGLSEVTVYGALNNHAVSKRTLKRLARVLGVSEQEIIL